MSLDQITPLLITYNEAPNIGRVLDRLTWAQRIVVVDSGSTDRTLEIVARYQGAEIVHRPFDSFADQCNFGLSCVRTPWALSLDADYVLSDALISEIETLDFSGNVAGYQARFIYVINERRLRGALYPPRTVLYQVQSARYRNEGHGHRVDIAGPVKQLRAPIYHDDRKPLSRWFGSQQKYAAQEAVHLLQTPPGRLKPQDRLRRMMWPAPILVFFYTLFGRGTLFDGWAGWSYALQRVLAECMLSLELIDRRFNRNRGDS